MFKQLLLIFYSYNLNIPLNNLFSYCYNITAVLSIIYQLTLPTLRGCIVLVDCLIYLPFVLLLEYLGHAHMIFYSEEFINILVCFESLLDDTPNCCTNVVTVILNINYLQCTIKTGANCLEVVLYKAT